MKDKHWAGLGIFLILAGIAGRLVPRASEGLSIFSILQVVGILLLLFVLIRRRIEIRRWVRTSPSGKPIRFLCGFLLLLVIGQCVWQVLNELERGDVFSPIERDIASTEPGAAGALQSYLYQDRGADTKRKLNTAWRERILNRLAELPRSEDRAADVIREIRWRLENGPEDSVRDAAVAALAQHLSPGGMLGVIADLPTFDEATRDRYGRALEKPTGMAFGGSAEKWLEWFAGTWAGLDDSDAFDLAERAWRKFAENSAARDLALERIAEGTGADAQRLADLIEDVEPKLRAAASDAIRTRFYRKLDGTLARQLKKESDSAAAAAMARAIAELNPPLSTVHLLDVVRTGVGEAGKSAAEAELAGFLQLGEGADLAAYLAGLYRKIAKGEKEKRDLFADLLAMASDSAVARRELAATVAQGFSSGGDRLKAMIKVLELEPGLLTDEVLKRVAEETPGSEMSNRAQRELDRR